MFFKTALLTLLSAASILTLTSASPAPLSPEVMKAKRASNEGVYLSNCDEFEPGILFSEMDFYSNAKSGSQNQEHPDATAFVSNGDVTWEGQQVCGFFSSSGETFCSNIESGAQGLVSNSMAYKSKPFTLC